MFKLVFAELIAKQEDLGNLFAFSDFKKQLFGFGTDSCFLYETRLMVVNWQFLEI